jgi:HK97 gp10 family phage protein
VREFSILGFVEHLAALSVALPMAEHKALETAAVIVEDTAKGYIGEEHSWWPPLAESTLAKKNANTPLLETGEMRDSIEHTVGDKEAQVGSNLERAVFHELGTSKMPPRPFLAHAAYAKGHEVADVIGRTMYTHLIGENVSALPERETKNYE